MMKFPLGTLRNLLFERVGANEQVVMEGGSERCAARRPPGAERCREENISQCVLGVCLVLILFCAIPQAFAGELEPSIDGCQQDLILAIDSIMGKDATSYGYFGELNNLQSVDKSPHLLLDEVEKLARKARIETRALCRQVGNLKTMNQDFNTLYHLPRCQMDIDRDVSLSITHFCQEKVKETMNQFLNALPDSLLINALRVSVQPLVERFRGLNSRMTLLVTEYSRMIKNFFTFNFRLGERIITKPD